MLPLVALPGLPLVSGMGDVGVEFRINPDPA